MHRNMKVQPKNVFCRLCGERRQSTRERTESDLALWPNDDTKSRFLWSHRVICFEIERRIRRKCNNLIENGVNLLLYVWRTFQFATQSCIYSNKNNCSACVRRVDKKTRNQSTEVKRLKWWWWNDDEYFQNKKKLKIKKNDGTKSEQRWRPNLKMNDFEIIKIWLFLEYHFMSREKSRKWKKERKKESNLWIRNTCTCYEFTVGTLRMQE